MAPADRLNKIISRQGVEKIIARGSCRPRPALAVLGPEPAHLEEDMAMHEMSFTRLLDAAC